MIDGRVSIAAIIRLKPLAHCRHREPAARCSADREPCADARHA
jgi:hypothetical protein